MTAALKVSTLMKSFPGFKLGPLDLELESGTVLGLLGPNGAGKSTTIHLIAGLLLPERGTVEVAGLPQQVRKPEWKLPIGFLGEERPFYESWTGLENLGFLAGFYPDWDRRLAAALAKQLDLDLEKPVRDLSRGSRVKLGLVAALAHRPRILLFDEPTDGLDPVVRSTALDLMRAFMAEEEEHSILYATHVLGDISRLADELAFIRDGKILRRERTDLLVDRWRQILFTFDGDLPLMTGIHEHRSRGSEHRITTGDYQAVLHQLDSIGGRDLHVSHLGIEEIAVAILKDREGGTEHA